MKNVLACFSITIVIVFVGCHPGDPIANVSDPSTCEGCHTNEGALVKLAPSEESGSSDGGGGG
ncbi:MAG: hypothetical protein H8E70_01440 [Candidatus Marinimicrobia bacterium]|nr:hypothetical protein [Candidatus Neomarinimicrobiota bacterium]